MNDMIDAAREWKRLDTAARCIQKFYRLYIRYSVMQSVRNSSKTDTVRKPSTYEAYGLTSFEQIITFAIHDYGREGVFRVKMRSLV